ncbi:hypothetical protein GGQ80_002630 [Sphingomonas jinjuensis]|uniref:SPOR domain-containing protein n=1 Tax=Sphingomonas jinjuensis TaxID=535907 RepID=A0A840FG71_9SPHN|nr:SPOR domain-containing protein [Sphingomonas jinjuensis]MBB4154714.1 hypothetical protein [Sphingomonas jinjuensis]
MPSGFREEDRLPWLETVESDTREGVPIGRAIGMVLLGLAVIAAIVFAYYKVQQRPAATGQLIPAPEGPYKVKPQEPGGMKVEGEGNAAIATSAGQSGQGAIDLNAVPEKPVEGTRVVPRPTPTDSGARNAVAQVPTSGGKLVAAAPVSVRSDANRSGGARGTQVQLGAYPSEALANAAWSGFSKRFGYLAPLTKSVQSVSTGGKTLYRLRVDAGSADEAAELCGRLRVAGEACFVAG